MGAGSRVMADLDSNARCCGGAPLDLSSGRRSEPAGVGRSENLSGSGAQVDPRHVLSAKARRPSGWDKLVREVEQMAEAGGSAPEHDPIWYKVRQGAEALVNAGAACLSVSAGAALLRLGGVCIG
jgi:hypothetical protein